MSVLAVLFLLALSHVDLSKSLHLIPPVNHGKHQFSATPKIPTSSRIYNPQGTAEAGQFPFQAYIVVDSAYLFGGALISAQYVLTSGSAIYGHSQWNVTLGMTDLSAAEPYREQQISNVASWYAVIQPSHSPGLIKLPQPVMIDEFVKPILLPTYTDVVREGTEVTITGFGYEGDGGPFSQVLKYAVLNVISNLECQTAYAGVTTISDVDICASGNGNPCAGDNGGPLFIDMGSSTFKVVGVNTFGWESCVTGHPAGFVRLTSPAILNWISEQTGIVIQS